MKKLLVISLALILLLSNLGLTMAIHFCGGQAVKSQLTVGHRHLDCGMSGMDMTDKNESEKGVDLKAENCCENYFQTLEIKDDYRSGFSPITLHYDFLIALVHTFLNIALFPEIDKPQYTNYSPPPLYRNLHVLNQIFII